jgi:RNA polymerase primary sigma factor
MAGNNGKTPVKRDYPELTTGENLSIYLKEINKITLLTREEEQYYARRAAEGDKSAKDKLTRANLRFVVSVAKKYQNQGLALVDLIEEGNIGLMNAIEGFDVEKGYHFISYAVWWIRQTVLKALCDQSRAVRLPMNRINQVGDLERRVKTLQANGRSSGQAVERVALEEGMNPEELNNLLEFYSKGLISLDTPVYFNEEDGSVLSDFVEGRYESPERTAMNQNLRDEINRILNGLSQKERTVIEYRFGLNGKSPLSLKELGEIFDLAKERIRQIEKKAINRLQTGQKSRRLREYYDLI